MNISPNIASTHKMDGQPSNYYSVEFALDSPRPVYQFKLRQSDNDALFFLVKENSDILSQLKIGHILPMKYYSDESRNPAKVHKTQIYEIVNDTQGRFRGHYLIKLEFVQDAAADMAQNIDTKGLN